MKFFNYIGIFKDVANIPDLEPTTTYQQITDSDEWVTCNVKVEALDVAMLSTSQKHGVVKGKSSSNFDDVVHYYDKQTLPIYKEFYSDTLLYDLGDQCQLIYMVGDTAKITAIPDTNNPSAAYNNSVLNGTFLGSVSKYYSFDDPPQYHQYTRGTPVLRPLRLNSGSEVIGAPIIRIDNTITENNKLSPNITTYRDSTYRPKFTQMVNDVESKITSDLEVVKVLKNKAVRAYLWKSNLFNNGNYCYSIEKTIESSSDYDICKQAYITWKNDVDSGLLTGRNETTQNLNFILIYYILKWIDACLDANSIVQNKPEEPIDNVTEYFGESGNANIEFTWKNDIVDNGELSYTDYKIYVHGEVVKKTENILDVLTSFNQADDLQVETDYSAKRITLPLKETIASMKSVGDIVGDLLSDYCAVFYLRGISDNQQRNTCFYICDTQTGKYISCGQMPDEQSIFTDTINHGSVASDDDNTDNTVDSDEPNAPNTPDVVGIGLLTTTYGLTPTKLKSIGSFIWESDWLSNLALVNNNPVENIVSCKVFPLSLPDGTDLIKIGNVATQVLGGKIDTTTYRVVQDIGELTVPKKFNSFLDYEPYTQLKLYVPFVGFVPISCASAYDGLSFRYGFDLINGSFTCSLKSGGKIVATYTGNCGVDIPITSNNRAQVETGYIRSALDLSTNPINVVNVGLDIATSQFHSQTVGNMGATTGLCQNLTPYVLAERPIASQPSTYGHDIGFKCEQSKTISELSGYTEINNIDIKGLSCTENEKNMIAQILATGFYA